MSRIQKHQGQRLPRDHAVDGRASQAVRRCSSRLPLVFIIGSSLSRNFRHPACPGSSCNHKGIGGSPHQQNSARGTKSTAYCTSIRSKTSGMDQKRRDLGEPHADFPAKPQEIVQRFALVRSLFALGIAPNAASTCHNDGLLRLETGFDW